MDKQIISIIFIILITPCCLTLLGLAFLNGGEGLLSGLGVALICVLPLILLAVAIGWQIQSNRRSRQAGAIFAAHTGLVPLSADTNPLMVWFGGDYQGRAVAVKPFAKAERIPDASGGTTSARFWMRVVMEVQLPQPLGFQVVPGPGVERGRIEQPQDALASEHLGRLSHSVREAMLLFVRKGYPTGLVGTTYRTSPGARSLALYDRDAVPAGLQIPDDVLPDAVAVLIHDHSDTVFAKDTAYQLLDDLSQVAMAIETGNGQTPAPPASNPRRNDE